MISLVALLATACAAVVTWKVRQPTQAELQVAALYQSVEETPYWQSGPPLMYERSREYLEDHFAPFDPNVHHGWDELPDTSLASPVDVVKSTNVFDGVPVTTVGMSNGGGQVGGQLLVQLQPIEESVVEKVRFDLLSGYSESDQETLLSNAVDSSSGSHMIILCLITPRPFVTQAPGWVWLIKGIPIASGRIFRGDGTTAEVAYLVCSSAERVQVD